MILLGLLLLSTALPAWGAEGMPDHKKKATAPLLNIPKLPPFPNSRYEIQRLSLSQVLMKTLGQSPSIVISRKEVSVRYAQRVTAIETFFPTISVGAERQPIRVKFKTPTENS